MIDHASDPPGPLLAGVSIADGDAAAARSDWIVALEIWSRLLDTADRPAARQRIRWFLAEAGNSDWPAPTRERVDRGRLLVVALGCAVVGTACVFLGQSQSGAARNALSAITWVVYIASAAMVVAYAFSGADVPRRTDDDLTETELLGAHDVAERLESKHPGSGSETSSSSAVRR